jgi:hypothetical protein
MWFYLKHFKQDSKSLLKKLSNTSIVYRYLLMGCGSSAAQADVVQSSRASVKDNKRGNRRNENGFKQVDIKYAEEYSKMKIFVN